MRQLFFESIDAKRAEEYRAAGIEPPKDVFSAAKTLATGLITALIAASIGWCTWVTIKCLSVEQLFKEHVEIQEEVRKKDKDHDNGLAILHQRITEESRNRANDITTIVQRNNDRFFELLMREYEKEIAERSELRKQLRDKTEKGR